MLLKIEQRRRLEMPRGSQSHPLWCRAESDALWTVPRKRPCTAEAWIHRCHLSSPIGIARRPPQCCCLTLVGARRMLLRWLNYNVLIHIDGNIDLYANRSLLSYMEF